MNSNEKKNNITPELNDDKLEQVSGGVITDAIFTFIATVAVGGAYKCNLCPTPIYPAIRALANHLQNMHGFTREDAMAAVPEQYRSIQWENNVNKASDQVGRKPPFHEGWTQDFPPRK